MSKCQNHDLPSIYPTIHDLYLFEPFITFYPSADVLYTLSLAVNPPCPGLQQYTHPAATIFLKRLEERVQLETKDPATLARLNECTSGVGRQIRQETDFKKLI